MVVGVPILKHCVPIFKHFRVENYLAETVLLF